MLLNFNIEDSTADAIKKWASFYRANPHRYAEDVLNLELRLFQKILLVMMNWAVTFGFIGSRGIGKTFLCAIFCVVRAILYPGTKIVIASGTRGQSINVLDKILLELRPKSAALDMEIDDDETQKNGTNAQIVFKNGSFIKVVTSSDSARGNRANILIIDEFRLVSKDVVDTILKKFLSNPRMPNYSKLSKTEKLAAWQKEPNKTLYLSSAYFSDSWAYGKCESIFASMLSSSRRGFLCGLPYELAILEGFLSRESVIDQMSETDFSEVKWSMEMGAEWFGAAEDAWFDFEPLAKARRIKYPMLPADLASKLGNKPQIRIQRKQPNEIRLLSVDVALMKSTKKIKNDATSIFMNQMVATKSGRHTSNIIFGDTIEGMRTADLALYIRKLFDEFECDYIVMDTAGVGLGVYDCLVRDISDPETGESYPAISCINNPEMAARCTVSGAPRVIWSIKANPQFNSDCAFLLREGFRSGRIRLLETEYVGETLMNEIQGFSSLQDTDKMKILYQYINTTLLINELVKLQYEQTGSRVRLFERSGMRKDRYSSLAYNYYVATQLENKLNRKYAMSMSSDDSFLMRAPSYKGKAVNTSYGGSNQPGWFH